MLENKKIRNPFPKIGLVFKYEFLSGLKMFVPVYSALLALSLVSGILYLDQIAKLTNDTVKILFGVMFALTNFVSFVLTIAFIEKRFKKSMLENEAYLNLTLPITTGEHIVGRLLAYFVWAVIYCLVSTLSTILMMIKEWKNIFTGKLLYELITEFNFQTNMEFFKVLFMFFVFAISIILLFVMFVFFINTVAHLVKKARGLIELALVVILFICFGRILVLIFPKGDMTQFSQFASFIWRFIILNFVTIILGGVSTSFMLKFRFNLEG